MMVILNVVIAAILLHVGLLDTNPDKIFSGELETVHGEFEFSGIRGYASSVDLVRSGAALFMHAEAGHTDQISEMKRDMTKKSSLSADDESLAVTGLWLSADKRGIIRIYEKDGLFYGRLVWLKEPEDDQGNAILDSENPDLEKRDQPILGLQMVFGLEYSDGEWRNGEIYDPESGNTYSARLRLNGNDRMDLRGYIRLPMFGRTESWTRVDTFPEDGKVWPGLEQG